MPVGGVPVSYTFTNFKINVIVTHNIFLNFESKKINSVIYSNGGFNDWETPNMTLINIVYNC